MRFEGGAAYALAVLLPLGEVIRRGRNVESIAAYADDFIIGGLLLSVAWSVSRRKAWRHALLVGSSERHDRRRESNEQRYGRHVE